MTNLKKWEHWYGFDLDGTLAYSDSNHTDMLVIGEPIPQMIDVIKSYIDSGKKVKIFTARAHRVDEVPGVITAIEDWCVKHIGHKLEVTNVKDPGLRQLFDDRAISVQKNTGVMLNANLS